MGGSAVNVRAQPDAHLPTRRRARRNRLGQVLLRLRERAEWTPAATAALVARFATDRRFRLAVAGPDFAELTADDLKLIGAVDDAMRWRAEERFEPAPSAPPRLSVPPTMRRPLMARPRERR